jgi:hypothetical protein
MVTVSTRVINNNNNNNNRHAYAGRIKYLYTSKSPIGAPWPSPIGPASERALIIIIIIIIINMLMPE